TVGVLAANLDVLTRAASVLIAAKIPDAAEPQHVHLLREAMALCDPEVQAALKAPIHKLSERFRVREISMREIDGEAGFTDLQNWYDIYRVVQRAEAESCLGGWVADAKPEFGSMIAQSFELIRQLDRKTVPPMLERRENYFRKMKSFLGERDLLLIPTIPSPAPLKGSFLRREGTGSGYYAGALSLTSSAGAARLPQLTLPLADVSGLPIGLSLIARNGQDAFLLSVAKTL